METAWMLGRAWDFQAEGRVGAVYGAVREQAEMR